jgi:hypothetical protein
MKSKEEIEQLAESEYPIKRGGSEWMPTTNDIKKATKQEGYIDGYTQCQEDMASKKLDVDDIDEMALDYIINTGGLPDSVEALQYCLHKFYEQIKKQD